MAEGDRRRHSRRARHRLVRMPSRSPRLRHDPRRLCTDGNRRPRAHRTGGRRGPFERRRGVTLPSDSPSGRRVYYATLAGLFESLMEAKTAANPARRLTVGITPSPRDSCPTRAAFPIYQTAGANTTTDLDTRSASPPTSATATLCPATTRGAARRPAARRERPGDDAYWRRHAARQPAIDSQLCITTASPSRGVVREA